MKGRPYVLGIVTKINGTKILSLYFTDDNELVNAITHESIATSDLKHNELDPLHDSVAVWGGGLPN